MALRLNGSTGFVALEAPTSAGSNTITLPTSNGSANQYLKNSGTAGILEFADLSDVGKVLQVITTNKDDTFSTSSTSFVDVTGLSATITPSSTSNKILAIASVMVGAGNAGADNYLRFLRGATTITNDFLVRTNSISVCVHYSMWRLDDPGTTSATTYKIQTKAEASDVYINRRNTATANGSSQIILLELAPN